MPPTMRPFIVLSLATSLLGGCSCQSKPVQQPSSSPSLSPGQVQKPPTAKPGGPIAPPPDTPLTRAMKLHAQARVTGESGNLQEALKQFQQAHELAPEWPFSLYDTALTYLLMGEADKALEVYQQVDKMAPEGFSDTKRVIDCLHREKDGRVPKGTFRKFIDAMRARTPEEHEGQLKALTKSAPKFYPAWREYAPYGKDVAEQLRLLEKALALEPDAESLGEMLIYKANLLRRAGKEAEARALLQSLVDDPKSLKITVNGAKEALSLSLPP
jgi:tetratricopeptide (TPR) repeat protein